MVVIGTVEADADMHRMVIRLFESNLKEFGDKTTDPHPTMRFKSVNHDHVFPERKPTKESSSIDGILKVKVAMLNELSCLSHLHTMTTQIRAIGYLSITMRYLPYWSSLYL